MKEENQVARIIKIYAGINGVASLLLGMIIGSRNILIPGLGVYTAAGGVVVSFLLYCIGECLQLLQDIKDKNQTKDILSSLSDIQSTIKSIERELKGDSVESSHGDDDTVVPLPGDSASVVICPLCETKQSSSRTHCWKCGAVFKMGE